MYGDYDSVIGFNKENFKKFQRDKDAIKNFPANGPGTISGLIVTADTKTGLAKNIQRLKIGSIRKYKWRDTHIGQELNIKKADKIKKRAKLFQKLSREITVAAKLGSSDPESNPRLRSYTVGKGL